MKFTHKSLLATAVVTALTGCGGSDGDSSAPNSAPVFDRTVVEAKDFSDVVSETAIANGDFTTAVVENGEDVQWEINVSERVRFFTNPINASAERVDYFTVDLLEGVSDPDGDVLSVKEVEFIWPGPDCSDTLSNAVQFDFICDDILEPLGYSAGQEGLTFIDITRIREAQNLPLIDEPVYGFDLRQSELRVSPRLFAPLLRNTQTAQMHMRYVVTDGEEEIVRIVKVTVDGWDSAPLFVEVEDDGSPRMEGGEFVPIPEMASQISEKSDVVTIDMLEGVFDPDVFNTENIAEEFGDLTELYDGRQTYQPELISVVNAAVTTLDGSEVPENFASTSQVFNPLTEKFEFTLTIDPSVYADILAGGENQEVIITYQVTDGDNFTTRSIPITVLGANEFNAPIFDSDLALSIGTNDFITEVDLRDGSVDPDGDSISVVNLTPLPGSEEQYGVDLSKENFVTIDPYAFTNLAEGETQTLSYTYVLSDGELASQERRVDIEITGEAANLIYKDPGFEQGPGSIGNGQENPTPESGWVWQWSANSFDLLSVSADAAHSGDWGAQIGDQATFLAMHRSGITQGEIVEGNRFYLSYFSKSLDPNAAADTRIQTFLNKNGVFSDSDILEFRFLGSNEAPVTEWGERIATYVASNFFDKDSTPDFNFTVQVNTDWVLDDFRLIKFESPLERQLIPFGNFNANSNEGWKVEGDGATLAVTEEANRNPDPDGVEYGLQIETGDTGGALVLDADNFAQGKVKSGIRYIVQFDARTASMASFPFNWSFSEVNGSDNFTRRLQVGEPSNTAWNTYFIHLDTGSDAFDSQGPVNSDLNFNWSDAEVEVRLQLPPNSEIQLDNINIYPVPRY
ncbi:hypothetical protein [Agaribacter marinus]|uniref:Uncharacterized protein n=1 Tax=Agaribacter marinus TaxID=1431249 RepID=A0AA37SVI4_9ALTE|nr:hypothetical protein [Agaribacter marinus]GLR70288.1 hypothetical protein GCM10007852_11960 [Agaribacter marinus]